MKNKTRYHLSSRGFTLIEVLISLTILSIIAVISIPNVRLFGQTQEIIDARKALVSFISQAQSNAVSSIQCSDSTLSSQRIVELQKLGYSLATKCWTSATNPTLKDDPGPKPSQTYPSSITMQSSSCGTDVKAQLVFSGGNVAFLCDAGGGSWNDITSTTNPFQITLGDARGNVDNLVIEVQRGGAISTP